jgi:hypothetical protein
MNNKRQKQLDNYFGCITINPTDRRNDFSDKVKKNEP